MLGTERREGACVSTRVRALTLALVDIIIRGGVYSWAMFNRENTVCERFREISPRYYLLWITSNTKQYKAISYCVVCNNWMLHNWFLYMYMCICHSISNKTFLALDGW